MEQLWQACHNCSIAPQGRIYEFYNKKECLNLQYVIEKLVTNKKIDLLAAA